MMSWRLRLGAFGVAATLHLALTILFHWVTRRPIPCRFISPSELDVTDLRRVLLSRGVFNTLAAVERSDYEAILTATGPLSSADLMPLPQEYTTVYQFTGQQHFEELVEDAKDSAWVVIAVTNDVKILSTDDLSTLAESLRPFGIRIGVFDCSEERHFCSARGWMYSVLHLALPELNRTGARVQLVAYKGVYKPLSILRWISSVLADRLPVLDYTDANQLVVLDTTMPNVMPLLFSALSVKFSGRLRFGLHKSESNSSSYLLDGVTLHRECSQPLSYSYLRTLLRFYSPDLSDIFLISMALVNLYWLLGRTLYDESPITTIPKSIASWVIVNFAVLLFWVIVVSLTEFAIVKSLTSALVSCNEYWASSRPFVALSPLLVYSAQNPALSCVAALIAIALTRRVFSRVLLSWADRPAAGFDMLSCLFSSSPRNRRNEAPLLLEAGIYLTVAEMSTPSGLWLHQGDPMDRTTPFTYDSAAQKIECSICLDTFEPGTRCSRLACYHEFHRTCISRWFETGAIQCPECRWNVWERPLSAEEMASQHTA